MNIPQTPATQRLLAPVDQISESSDFLHLRIVDDSFLATPLGPCKTAEGSSWHSHSYWPPRVPGSERVNGGCSYLLPKSDYACLVIKSVWKDRIVFQDSETKDQFNFFILRFIASGQLASAQAQFWDKGVVPEDAPVGSDDPSYRLTPYQRVAAWCALKSPGFGLFMEQGCGKTATMIAVLDELAKEHGHQTTLIVCPNNVRSNWESEIEKFSNLNVSVYIAKGGPPRRLVSILQAQRDKKKSLTDWSAVIISYDSLAGSASSIEMLDIDNVVCDETQYIKSHKTKRHKGLQKVKDVAERRFALTGTPIANTVMDLYTQLELIGDGWSGFTNFDRFKRFHGQFERRNDSDGTSVEKLVGANNVPLLQERLARCSFICTKKQALPELPDKVFSILEVELGSQQKKIYDKLAQELYAECEEMLEDASPVSANNVLTRLLRLSQITSGFVVTDGVYDEESGQINGRETLAFDTNPKLDQVENLIDTELGEKSKCVVWAYYRNDIEMIYERLSQKYKCVRYHGGTKDVDREEAKESFNHGDARIFIANPASGGTGINLLGKSDEGWATDMVIRYSSNWSSLDRMQSNDRTHRKGMARPCFYYDILATDTIDFQIHKRVTAKVQSAANLQDVQAILREVMSCVKQP